jgi:type I restriction enzyme S subunit
MILGKFANLNSKKVSSSLIKEGNYISTENMLPNFGGFLPMSPTSQSNVTAYCNGNILLSNIRPYFRKLVYATCEGGCSNDVICISCDESICLSRYLFYALSTDTFFGYYAGTCKGTKMPRGDKAMLLKYQIDIPSLERQQHIVDATSSLR